MIKKYKRLWLAGLGVVAIVIIANLVFAAKDKPPTVKSTGQPVSVIVAKVSKVNVPSTVTAVGVMKAIHSVDLSFDVSGRLTKIYLSNGERVKQGEQIAELDDASAAAQLESYEAAYQLAESDYQRTVKLRKVGAVSEQMLESQRAKAIQAKSQVEQQKVLIAEMHMTAPFDGVLGDFKYSTGAYLPAGTDLVNLVQESPLLVEYSVPADSRSGMEIGQSVTIRANAFPDQDFSGIVSYISPSVNMATGTVTVQAKIDNPDFLLLPGMFVSIRQVIQAKRELTMVPDLAVMTDINGQYVYQVTGDHVKKVYIQVGVITGGKTQVESGLKPGDEVVVAGQQKLDSGDEISILKTQLPTFEQKATGKKVVVTDKPSAEK